MMEKQGEMQSNMVSEQYSGRVNFGASPCAEWGRLKRVSPLGTRVIPMLGLCLAASANLLPPAPPCRFGLASCRALSQLKRQIVMQKGIAAR